MYIRYVKPAMDVLMALFVLLLTFPLFVLLIPLVAISNQGNVFFVSQGSATVVRNWNVKVSIHE